MKFRIIMLVLAVSLAAASCELKDDKEKDCKPKARAIIQAIMIQCSDPAYVADKGYASAADCTSKRISGDLNFFVYFMNCFFCEEDEEACL